jgi:hypothetical protein
MHEFEIRISGLEGASLVGEALHTLDGGEHRSISLRVRVAPELLDKPNSEFMFTAEATDTPSLRASTETRFMKPL